MGYLPAAALDLVMYPFPTEALWPGESAVAAAHMEPDAQHSGTHRWDPPLPRFDLAAPLCRRTPNQSGIHNEPNQERQTPSIGVSPASAGQTCKPDARVPAGGDAGATWI